MLGIAVGLVLQSPWLAALLALSFGVIGHVADSRRAAEQALRERAGLREPLPPPATASEIDAELRLRFARHLCAVFVEVARCDGEITREEIREVRLFFEEDLRFSSADLEPIRLELKRAIAQPAELRTVSAACRDTLSEAERQLMLHALYGLCLADGPLTAAERRALAEAGAGLGLSEEERRSVAAEHLGEADRAHALLGLTPEAGNEEVKRAYRRLAAAHHPDRVAHLGKRAVERAEQHFREIREAYEEILRARGL